MHSSQREKLRQLPQDQQEYLLQQHKFVNKKTPTKSHKGGPTPVASSPVRSKPFEPRSLRVPRNTLRPSLEKSNLLPPTGQQQDVRAAAHKFNSVRRRAPSNLDHRSSKVGSMILEFDALAQPETSDPMAWLILDDKRTGLPRATPTNTIGPTPSPHPSTRFNSLTRKDGNHLAALTDDRRSNKTDSPYFFTERLRGKNTPLDALAKHLISLRKLLTSDNVAFINEFLSRRHDGLSALETVLERLNKKRYCFPIVGYADLLTRTFRIGNAHG